MKLRDRALIGALSVALICLSIAALAPSLQSSGNPVEPTPPVPPGRALRRGRARAGDQREPVRGTVGGGSRARRRSCSGASSGSGPGSSIVGDLATRWEVDDTGRSWTFHLRPDQFWEDGEPITADDVAFTVGVLADPLYTGPGAESWRDVTRGGHRSADRRAPADDAARRLPPGRHAADRAGAPPRGRARRSLIPDDPFGTYPIGSGPFRLSFLDPARAVLVAATPVEPPGNPGRPNFTTPRPTDSLRDRPRPTQAPDVAVPHLANVELRYYDDIAAPPGRLGGRAPRRGLGPPAGGRRASSPRPPAPGSFATRARRSSPRRRTCGRAGKEFQDPRCAGRSCRRSIGTRS